MQRVVIKRFLSHDYKKRIQRTYTISSFNLSTPKYNILLQNILPDESRTRIPPTPARAPCSGAHLSVMRRHPCRLRSSMLLHCSAKVRSAGSVTHWQPWRLSAFRNPPERRLMFSTTQPCSSQTPAAGQPGGQERSQSWTHICYLT